MKADEDVRVSFDRFDVTNQLSCRTTVAREDSKVYTNLGRLLLWPPDVESSYCRGGGGLLSLLL
jgi:hypothetical protein